METIFPLGGRLTVGFVFATEIFRQRRSLSVFLSPEKEKLEKKELQGGCPLDPRCGERHHHRMGYQREDSVQAAQRGQIKARTVKHSAANYPWLPLEGKLSASAD